MAMDVAQLSIRIDSTDATRADKSMQALAGTAGFTEKQMRVLASGVGETTRQARELASRFSNTGSIITQSTARALAGVAGLGFGIEGLVHAWTALQEATDRAFEVQAQWVDFSAKAAIGASNVGKALRDEMLAIVDSRTSVRELTGEHDRLMVLRAELLAQGPEYRTALWDENAGYVEILNTLRAINEEKLKMVNNQIAETIRKGPEQSWKRFLKSDTNQVSGFYDGGRMHTTSRLGSTFDTMADTAAQGNQLKYEKTLNDLYKQRADLMKGVAGLNGAYDKPGKPGAGGGRHSTDWDALARSAMGYANTLKMLRQEYEVVMSGGIDSSYLDDIYKLREESAATIAEIEIKQAQMAADAQTRLYSDMFGDMRGTLQGWANESKDVLGDFITTGKADFRGMINDWINDLARLALQQGLMSLFSGGQSSGSGWGSVLGSLFGGARAEGGPVSGGTPYLVGERGPELFVPKNKGTIVPAGGFGGGVSVTNHININRDGQVDVKTEAGRMQDLGSLVAAKTRETIIHEMRQGGMLARA